MAPAANILLVEMPSANDLFTGVNWVRTVSGVSTVSMSWAGPEFSGETAYDPIFTTPAGHNGVTFIAASGDNGRAQGQAYRLC